MSQIRYSISVIELRICILCNIQVLRHLTTIDFFLVKVKFYELFNFICVFFSALEVLQRHYGHMFKGPIDCCLGHGLSNRNQPPKSLGMIFPQLQPMLMYLQVKNYNSNNIIQFENRID